MKKLFFPIIFVLSTILGCIKEDFDRPAQYQDPNIATNQTIRGLKDAFKKYMDSTRKNVMTIEDDWVISGIVTADDKSQNFYKEIVIQDSTAGIGITIDQNSLYNDYPVGRRVFIKLKGMAIGQSNNLIQLGGYYDTISQAGAVRLGRVVSTNIRKHIIKGTLTPSAGIVPLDISIDQLNDDYQYRLVRLSSLEFNCDNIHSTYADAINLNDASRILSDGKGKTIILRNSGYATFAGKKLPSLNGDIIAIYTVYNNDKQLKIRDTTDLTFENLRIEACEAGSPITIKELRNIYKGTSQKLNAVAIEGTVISDRTGNNINGQNIIIQDNTAGIMVRFSSTHSFNVGDKLRINLRGGSLETYSALLQVNNVAINNVEFLGANNPVVPREATVEQINANFADWESTLIKIVGATISATGTNASKFSGSKTITQAGKTITMFTSSGATFASLDYPTGSVDIVGYLGVYNTTKQIQIRTEKDVTGSSSSGGGGGSGSTTATRIPIDSVRMLRPNGTAKLTLTQDRFIEGIVISDRVGKNINSQNVVIQDDKAGILVRFTATHSFNLGDKVKVNIKGYSLENYNNLLQINNVPLSAATKTGTGTITPRSVSIAQINANFDQWESTLVKIDKCIISGNSPTYSGSKTLTQTGNTITLFTLSTADFANSNYPTIETDLTGILSIYNTTKQVMIRNTTDVSAQSSGGGGSGGGISTVAFPLDSLRMMDPGTAKPIISLNRFIEGVVISNRINNSIDSRNLVIQDATGGVVVRFTANHSFNLGDKVKININGFTLENYNGLLQVNNVTLTSASVNGTGTITPRVTTFSEINTNFEKWESTLVKVSNVSFPSGTFSGSKTLTSPSGSIIMYTRPQASSIANATMPNSPKTITGYLTQFTDKQIQIRSLDDIE